MRTLPVIFRKSEGEVVAVFPTQPESATTMMCYAHVGQHSSCSFDFYNSSDKAYPSDYQLLLRELESIYREGEDPVKLVVVQKRTYQHRVEFERRLLEMQK